ncbi:MAG: FG-GAP repeat protein [Verrucomicrobiaceae bacterium]|nr:FG-GAP repeat protein [Verrucomicrobiaceae bacterium]
MKTLLLALASVLAVSTTATAISPTILKLRSPSGSQGGSMGWALAGNEKWLLVGEPGNSSKAAGAGAVNVYEPKSGKLLRQIFATDAESGDQFGISVALSGNLAVVGAYFEDSLGAQAGAAYVFDVSTGKQLFKLTGSDSVAGDLFGRSTAVHGDRVLVGTTNPNNQRGAVYVFDATTGIEIRKLTADDAVDGDQFGQSLALNGCLALIGAPGVDSPATNSGAVYVYDISSGTKLHRLLASSSFSLASAALGTSVAMSGHHGLAGAPSQVSGTGAVFVFDLRTGVQTAAFQAVDATAASEFGNSLAVSGRLALVGCHEDDNGYSNQGSAYLFDWMTGGQVHKITVSDPHANQRIGKSVAFAGGSFSVGGHGVQDDGSFASGACYLFTGFSAPLPLQVLAKKSDYVTDVGEAVFSSFNALQINADGETLAQSKLSGSGTTGGKNIALHSTLSGTHDQVLRTGLALDGDEYATAFSYPQLQHAGRAAFQMKLKGSLITSANDMMLVGENGSSITILLQESNTLNAGGFTGQVIQSLGAQASSTTDELVSVFSSLTADSTADSAVILHNIASNVVADSVREGAASPFALINYGQVTNRVSMTGSDALVSASLTGDTSQNAAVVRLSTAGPDFVVARKGDAAPGTTGFFSSFIGEGSNALNQPIIRASLSGVSSTTNEGIWANRGASLGLVAQKGTQVTGLDTGVMFSSFIRAWMLPTDRVLFLAKLKGTGVKSSNDCALFLALPDGSLHVMMREGDYAPDGQGTKIGSISQIDVDEVNATYAIIASLSGAVSSSNQALFVGDADIAPAPGQEELLRPRMALRKGSYQGLFGSTSALSSIKMLLPTESAGIGSRGLGGAIGGNRVAVQLAFSNKSVMIGIIE